MKKLDTITEAQYISNSGLMIYRIVAGVLYLVIAVVIFIPGHDGFVFYLTNWGYVLTLVYMWYVIVYGANTLYFNHSGRLHKLLLLVFRQRCVQFLFELVWTTELVITLWFWIAAVVLDLKRSGFNVAYAIISHTVPFIFIGVENVFNGIRFRRYDFLALQLVYIPYGVLNWLCVKLKLGPSPVYPHVTWDNWATVLAIVGSELTAFLAFLVGYFIAECKHKKRIAKLCRHTEPMLNNEIADKDLNVKIEECN